MPRNSKRAIEESDESEDFYGKEPIIDKEKIRQNYSNRISRRNPEEAKQEYVSKVLSDDDESSADKITRRKNKRMA
jgi:hypothetical protein